MNSWKLEQARLRKATELGETIARTLGVDAAPVSPFDVIKAEGNRIRPFGEDFDDAFDGRLEFHSPYFVLFFNTKYDAWPHNGPHHPKVLFTIGHELGHYYLEPHRDYLMQGGGAHGSMSEFVSNNLSEREADCFTTGLLMPKYLLGRIVNRQAPSFDAVRRTKDEFRVSLTSMMIRWVQLCDFPCAMVSITGDHIDWGFTSDGFRRFGGWRVRRGERIGSRSAKAFFNDDTSLANYREGEGWSVADRWMECNRPKTGVHESYVVVPRTKQMLVFITADEDDLE